MQTSKEKIALANAAIELLDDDEMVKQFAENVKQVGTWANQIDASFDNLTRKFNDMVQKYGQLYPGLNRYRDEWVGYNKSWNEHLSLSRDVASEHIALLRRFNRLFIPMIESIKTDQDRKDVIVELQRFADEKHDRSREMSVGFLTLKRDIQDFPRRLNEWTKHTGIVLQKGVEGAQSEIDRLQSEIELLDRKIGNSTVPLILGTCLWILGIFVLGSDRRSRSQRDAKLEELRKMRSDREDANRGQPTLANLKSDLDGVKPDITLLCEKLALFAGIWASVRSQTIQFQEHLKGGMGALTNLQFQMEISLAKKMCIPLQTGLGRYATELENRKSG